MVSRCANPDCGAPFLYLREGKLVAVRRAGEGHGSRVEFFWLCGMCASHLRFETADNGDTNVVAIPQAQTHARHNSPM